MAIGSIQSCPEMPPITGVLDGEGNPSLSQTIIKKIVGHAGAMSLTERVYTHLDVNELIEAIDQI